MASNVNLKFIVIAGALLTLVGGLGLWYAADRVFKSADESAALGDEAAAKGDWETAMTMYSRAVAKDQGNVAWIGKWLDAIRKTTPPTTQLYSERYFGDYMLALRANAEAQRDKVEPFSQYLQEVHTRLSIGGGDLGAWEAQLGASKDFIQRYRGDQDAGRVLRRFPGLAGVQLLQLKSDVNPEVATATVADLEAALAADPADEECAIGLSAIDILVAEDHRKRSEDEQYASRLASARKRLEDFVKAHPPATASRMAILQLDMSDYARTAEPGTTRAEAFRSKRDQVQQLVDAAFGERKDSMRQSTVVAVADLAETALESGANTADMLFTQALQGRPNDPMLLLTWGRMEMLRNNTDKAVERLQTLVDLPNPPICLEGVLLQNFRGRAVSFQVDALFAAWESAKTAADKEAIRARVKERRDKLTSYVAADSPLLLSIDARSKYMEQDLSAARKLLADYNEQTGSRDLLTVQLLAEVLLQQGNVGAAKTNYEHVLELNPRSIRALTRLSEMAVANQDYALAKKYMQTATNLAPRDEQIKQSFLAISELAAGSSAQDPVIRVMSEVRELTSGVAPDYAAATAKVRDSLRTSPGNARLSRLLADLLVVQDDKQGALEAIRAAIAANPEDAALKRHEQALNDPDPVNSRLLAIDQSTLDDLQRHIARYQVLSAVGRSDEANAQLDAAAKLAPNDPLVVELLFTRAIQKSDVAELDRLCTVAESLNLDQARGLVFRTRRDLLVLSKEPMGETRKGRLESVAAGLRTALGQDRLNPALWRMLGMVQFELGQGRAASDSFTQAVNIRPNDVLNNTSLVKSLVALGEYDDALQAARRAETLCGRDPEFARLLLFLESDGPGGDRAKALAARQRIALSNPDDLENKLSIVSLLLQFNRVDEAEPIATELEQKDKRLGTAARAGIFARRGNAAGAVEVYRTYLDSVSDLEQARREYITAATFLAQVVGRAQAISLLEPARAKQDPAKAEFDRAIADLHFEAGDFEKAVEAYKRVLSSGIADTDYAILKRLVESHLRRAQFQQAEDLLAAAPEEAKTDAVMLILKAQAAAGLGNTDGARRALDQAVAAAPENFLVYLKRAEFTSSDPARNRDTEADLEQALKLRPDLTVARRMLATMYFSSARTEQGIEQIRKALAATPGDVALRMDFVELLIALQRVPEALDLLEEPMKANPTDLQWKMRAAQVNTRTGRFDRATHLMGEIFERAPTPEVAELYVISLTSGPTPNATRAMEVLRNPALRVDDSWRLIMLRARVWARSGPDNQNKAKDDAKLAWGKIDQSSGADVDLYFKIFVTVFDKPETQLTTLAALDTPRTPFTGWPLYQASVIRSRVPALAEQSQSGFRQLTETPGLEPRLVAAAWSALGANAYRAKDYEGALSAFQRALAATPDDPELGNNVAYTLGVDLKRPNEAIPYAEAAAQIAKSSPMILDTLGTLYHKMGRNDEALPILEKAVNISTAPSERVPALIHFASALHASGEKARAKHFADLAGQFIASNPVLKDYYEAPLKELLQTLDGQ